MRKILLVMLLAGCGGGGDGDPAPTPDANPGGFYTGSFVSDAGAVRVDGLVLESGEAMFLSDFGIYVSDFQPDGTDLDAEFEAFALLGSTWDGVNTYLTGNIEATVSEGSGINGTYTLGGDSGTFTLSYDAARYEIPSSLASLDGDWGYSVPATGYAVSVSIDSAGGLFGQDTNGCVYTGSASTVNSAFNAYRLTGVRFECPGVSISGGDGMGYLWADQGIPVFIFGVGFAQQLALIDFWYKQ